MIRAVGCVLHSYKVNQRFDGWLAIPRPRIVSSDISFGGTRSIAMSSRAKGSRLGGAPTSQKRESYPSRRGPFPRPRDSG